MDSPITTTPPPDLYGRAGADRFMRGLTAFNDFYLRVMDRALWREPRAEPPVSDVSAWRDLVIAERTDVCDGAVSLRLKAPDGSRLRSWQPGAHLRIELPSGRIRHYSLCGDPYDQYSYTITVRRIDGGHGRDGDGGGGGGGGGGSTEIHEHLHQGSPIRVMCPRNAFPFAAEPDVLFIAGGIGITPILPMVREAASRNLNWRLVYSGRNRAALPFIEHLQQLPQYQDRVEILADDETGLPNCADLVSRAPLGAAVYCCGPAPMLDGVRTAVDLAGSKAISAFHYERFTAAPVIGGRDFELELAADGTVLPVPADRSALDVLRDHDPATPYSCRQGFCGICRLRVVSGRVEHHDRRLTDGERAAGDMLVCVSRAAEGERLVIDR